MAMSDCVKCWDTPCTCGHDLLDRSLEWLLNQQKIINAEIDRRHPKIHHMEVELMRFGVPSPAGLTYVLTPEVIEAVRNFSAREIRCEFGQPAITRERSVANTQRMGKIADERLCGMLSNVRFNPETSALLGDFTTTGPFGQQAAELLNEGTGRLACRSFADTDHDRKTRTIKRLITFDVVAVRDPLDYNIPDIKEEL